MKTFLSDTGSVVLTFLVRKGLRRLPVEQVVGCRDGSCLGGEATAQE